MRGRGDGRRLAVSTSAAAITHAESQRYGSGSVLVEFTNRIRRTNLKVFDLQSEIFRIRSRKHSGNVLASQASRRVEIPAARSLPRAPPIVIRTADPHRARTGPVPPHRRPQFIAPACGRRGAPAGDGSPDVPADRRDAGASRRPRRAQTERLFSRG